MKRILIILTIFWASQAGATPFAHNAVVEKMTPPTYFELQPPGLLDDQTILPAHPSVEIRADEMVAESEVPAEHALGDEVASAGQWDVNMKADGETIVDEPVRPSMGDNETLAVINDVMDQAPLNNDEPAEASEQTPLKPASIVDKRISQAYFTADIAQRNPLASIDEIQANKGTLFFFTELWGMQGKTVIHRWESNGRLLEEVRFTVGGPKWRVWSRYDSPTQHHGHVKAGLYDENGRLLASQTLVTDTVTSPHYAAIVSP